VPGATSDAAAPEQQLAGDTLTGVQQQPGPPKEQPAAAAAAAAAVPAAKVRTSKVLIQDVDPAEDAALPAAPVVTAAPAAPVRGAAGRSVVIEELGSGPAPPPAAAAKPVDMVPRQEASGLGAEPSSCSVVAPEDVLLRDLGKLSGLLGEPSAGGGEQPEPAWQVHTGSALDELD